MPSRICDTGRHVPSSRRETGHRRGHRHLLLRDVLAADVAEEALEGDVAGVSKPGFDPCFGDDVGGYCRSSNAAVLLEYLEAWSSIAMAVALASTATSTANRAACGVRKVLVPPGPGRVPADGCSLRLADGAVGDTLQNRQSQVAAASSTNVRTFADSRREDG